jgi:NADH-quinone oxidoreductase subunit M
LHGFVVVGLFYAAEIISEDETRAIAEMGGIRTQSPKFTMFFDFGISICCLPTTFNFIGNSPFYTVFHK